MFSHVVIPKLNKSRGNKQIKWMPRFPGAEAQTALIPFRSKLIEITKTSDDQMEIYQKRRLIVHQLLVQRKCHCPSGSGIISYTPTMQPHSSLGVPRTADSQSSHTLIAREPQQSITVQVLTCQHLRVMGQRLAYTLPRPMVQLPG